MVVGFDLCHCFAVCLNWRNFVECQPNVNFVWGITWLVWLLPGRSIRYFALFPHGYLEKSMILQLHDKNYTFSLFSEKAPYESYKNVGFLSNILIHSPANHVIPQQKSTNIVKVSLTHNTQCEPRCIANTTIPMPVFSNHETKTKITPNQVTLVSFTLENIPTHARSAIGCCSYFYDKCWHLFSIMGYF